MTSIAIIGGGLSGLATAWNLLKQENVSITLFETSARLGGKIRSSREDGFLYEHGPNGFMDSRQEMVDFCNDLGLADRIVKSNDSAAERYILQKGSLKRLPKKPPQIFTWNFLPLSAKLRLLTEPFRKKSTAEDETVYDFCNRRMGKKIAEYLVDPFTSGVFGADCRQLSVKAAFPALWEMEQEYGSLFKGLKAKLKAKKGQKPGKLSSFKDGMQELIDALVKNLSSKVTVRLNSKVERACKSGTQTELTISELDSLSKEVFDIVIMACPAHQTGEIIAPIYPQLKDKILDIPYSAMTVVPQGFNKPRPENLNAFGFLVPSAEKSKLLGTLFDSSIFPARTAESSFSIRTMLGGGKDPDIINYSDDDVLKLILSENRQILGLDEKADFTKIIRWQKAIPVYKLGHSKLVKEIEDVTANTPVFIVGNAFYGVSMNDCVSTAAETARKVKDFLEK
jgi:protoporphyrinogen/coproporphyrinogen III oxidase